MCGGKKEALEEPVRWAPGFKEHSWRRNYKGSEDGRLHSACAVCHVHGVASWWFSGAPEDLRGPSCTRKMCAARLFPCEWLQIEWDMWAVRMACPGCSFLATNHTLLTAKGGWPPSSHWEQGYCLGLGWVKVASIEATSDGKHKLHAAWRWEHVASRVFVYLPECSFFVASNQLI